MSGHAHLDGYFETASRHFADAVDRTDTTSDRYLTVGRVDAHFRFAGAAMAAKVLPAMQHLVNDTPPTDVDLTLIAWDQASTGVELPPPRWEGIDYRDRANARVYSDDRFSLCYERRLDLFSAIDRDRGLAIAWTHDADALPADAQGTPLERLLQGWLKTKGLLVVHASAVGTPHGGLLLAGRSGSGKSTTAVHTIESDLLYLGDDCALVQGEPTPTVHALYNSARLRRDALERLPKINDAVVNPTRSRADKALIFLHSCAPEKLARELPLRAIALPRVTGRADTVVSRASPIEAYRAIGPDTALTMLGGDAAGVLALIKSLVSELPCYHLALGTNGDGVTAALHQILDGATS